MLNEKFNAEPKKERKKEMRYDSEIKGYLLLPHLKKEKQYMIKGVNVKCSIKNTHYFIIRSLTCYLLKCSFSTMQFLLIFVIYDHLFHTFWISYLPAQENKTILNLFFLK
jgi:hypothetical protein